MAIALIAGALAAVLLVALGSAPPVQASPGDYDADGNGVIDRGEAIEAIADYLSGTIDRADVLDVIRSYLTGAPVGPGVELSGLRLTRTDSGSAVGLTPAFSSAVSEYAAQVEYGTATVTVAATAGSGATTTFVLADGISPQPDADARAAGHQVALGPGDSVIRIRAVRGGSDHVHTVTVTRAKPTVTIRAGAATAGEGDGLRFTVARDPVASDALAVRIEVGETGGFVSQRDRGVRTVTIAGGASSANHTVRTAADDGEWDAHSAVRATLRADASYELGTANSARTWVIDDDFPQASAQLTVTPNPAREGGRVTATVTVTADRQPHGYGGVISVRTLSGTATSPLDYAPLVRIHQVHGSHFRAVGLGGAGPYRATYSAAIGTVDDDIGEGSETFSVSMTKVGADRITLGAPAAVSVSIGDSAGSTLGPDPGLWAGRMTVPEDSLLPNWFDVRIVPGDDPDVDDWRLESGPMSGLIPPAVACPPTTTDDGWMLDSCSGLVETDLSVLVPRDPAREAEVSLTFRGIDATARMTPVSQRDEPAASGNVTVLWHQPGSGLHSDIWVADGLVFAPRFDGTTEIIDAATGRILGEARVPDAVLDVKAAGGVLHLATYGTGLWTFDVSDPSSPRQIGRFEGTSNGDGTRPETMHFHNIFLSPDGRAVYVIDNGALDRGDLAVVDVSNPSSPALAGRYRLREGPVDPYGVTHDVHVVKSNDRLIAYLNHLEEGLLILDVTDPGAISMLGSTTWAGISSHSGWTYTVGGRLYYAHTEEGFDRHLTVLDVTNPAAPEIVSRFATRKGVSIHNVQVVEGIAYISYYLDGLRVVDLRDPARPREVAHFDTVPERSERGILQGAWGVMVLDGVVYISDIESGTYALSVQLD